MNDLSLEQAAHSFSIDVLKLFLNDVHRIEPNNYDAARFSYDGVDRSQVFETERHALMLDIFMQQRVGFFVAWQKLKDQASKDLFIALIRYQLSGHNHVRLPTNTDNYWGKEEGRKLLKNEESTLGIEGEFGAARHFDIEVDGQLLKVDGYFIENGWLHKKRQYYFERGGAVIKPEAGDYVIDAGACMGDTCISFAQAVGIEGCVYAFDFLPAHVKACRHNFEQNAGLSNFKMFEQGVSNEVYVPEALQQNSDDKIMPGYTIVGQEKPSFPTTTIDHLVEMGEIEKVDFIKMDIEGSELAALQGAEQTIRKFKPKLAISIYHIFVHYFEIMKFIDSLGLGYEFYIEHYTIHSEETVLYARVL